MLNIEQKDENCYTKLMNRTIMTMNDQWKGNFEAKEHKQSNLLQLVMTESDDEDQQACMVEMRREV